MFKYNVPVTFYTIILFALLLSLIGAVAGYIATNSMLFNICFYDEPACRIFFNQLGDPLLYGMSSLALVFLMLLVFPHAFFAWKKFAIWFIPIAVLIFISYPEPGAWDYFSPDPEQVYQWISGLYVVISLVIILVSYLRRNSLR